jgi:hypothetical protein
MPRRWAFWNYSIVDGRISPYLDKPTGEDTVKLPLEPKPANSRNANKTTALENARKALLDYLPKDQIIARFQRGAGEELLSGKFVSPESSAALVANAFGFFIQQPGLLFLPTPRLQAGSALAVLLEEEVRFGWRGGFHPWLDVVVETDERFIGIESKRYEPFRDEKKIDFSSAFDRDVWGRNMGRFDEMRKALISERKQYAHLDAAQLVKHAYGLYAQAKRRGKSACLVYLYSEPKAYPTGRQIPRSSLVAHAEEVSDFAEAVSGADVQFASLRYADLLNNWATWGGNSLPHHAEEMQKRYDV